MTITRRNFLDSAAATALLLALLGRPGDAAAAGLSFGEPGPFTFDGLIATARERASRAHVPPDRPAPDIVQAIDYATHGNIHFRPEDALFADGPGVYPATFFHLGRYFPTAVRIYAVEQGMARELFYSPDYFDMPADSIARQLPPNAGFAGFRFQGSRHRADWQTKDWVAFAGASYFRAIGALGQYGLSARGVCVDTVLPTGEEFPDFVAFYIESAPDEDQPAMVHALLDGPSLSGAYRFALRRTTGVIMDVEAALFIRRDIQKLGIAPLTSMFWYAEYDRGLMVDWRPEVHDSDGLALWTGRGERIWRPLNNPPHIVTSSFLDESPRGFGLLQRDRDFDHYLDGVNYDLRPSLWVEPLEGWDAGAVELAEIPTDDEINDNIVAFWVPKQEAKTGTAYRFRYRLHWLADEPYPATEIARTFATRVGRGGEPGQTHPKGTYKFVIEFVGAPLSQLTPGDVPVPVVNASRGDIANARAEPIPNTKRWRAVFDLAAAGSEPIELRLYLRLGNRPLTETWLYQYLPPPEA